VLQIRADLLIRAFRVARDSLEVRFDLRVVIDFEVVGRINVPLEIVVPDLVLAEVGNVRRLRDGVGDDAEEREQKGGEEHARSGTTCRHDIPLCAALTHDSPRKAAAEAGSPAANANLLLASPMLL
jgi:hypothetical protein